MRLRTENLFFTASATDLSQLPTSSSQHGASNWQTLTFPSRFDQPLLKFLEQLRLTALAWIWKWTVINVQVNNILSLFAARMTSLISRWKMRVTRNDPIILALASFKGFELTGKRVCRLLLSLRQKILAHENYNGQIRDSGCKPPRMSQSLLVSGIMFRFYSP